MNSARSEGCRRKTSRGEQGWALATTMIAICIVSVALVNHAMVTCVGAAAARQSRYAFACRQAATDRLAHFAPGSAGGNLAPASPLPDWSDIVYVDPSTAAVVISDTGNPPAGSTLVLRQWRIGSDGAGLRVFEVSAVAFDASRRPRRGPLAASIVLSKRLG
jgi:hypothetical protein